MAWRDAVHIEWLRNDEPQEQRQFTLGDFYTFAADQLARKHPERPRPSEDSADASATVERWGGRIHR